MKRTLSLIGLFFIGLGLLFNPVTGVVGISEPESLAVPSTAPIVTTGEPPPEPEPATTATIGSATTTTTEPPATNTQPPTTTTVTVPRSPSVTVTGPAVETEWGFFQVEIAVEDGVLVSVAAVQEPGDQRSRRINAQALPIYEELAVEAQSADIDVISGATVTWLGYTSSLQAALDDAGIG